jgi:hypothetical protein
MYYIVNLIVLQEIWYHLDRKSIEGQFVLGCSCPGSTTQGNCFHMLYMTMFGKELFPLGCTTLAKGACLYVLSQALPCNVFE